MQWKIVVALVVALLGCGQLTGPGHCEEALEESDLQVDLAPHRLAVRPTPDNFSVITSLARRMPNGNTFVAFGAGPGLAGSFGPVEAFEVDPNGAVGFRIEIGGPLVNDSFVLYRASPLSTIAGEQRVE